MRLFFIIYILLVACKAALDCLVYSYYKKQDLNPTELLFHNRFTILKSTFLLQWRQAARYLRPLAKNHKTLFRIYWWINVAFLAMLACLIVIIITLMFLAVFISTLLP